MSSHPPGQATGQSSSHWPEGPAYLPIVEAIRAQIRSGELPPGTQLPSLPEMQRRYGATEGVVRRALGELRTLGLISTHQGKGSFVRDAPAAGEPSAEYQVLKQLIGDLSEQIQSLDERVAGLERERPRDGSAAP
jgi:GntR family transcriptional regulator